MLAHLNHADGAPDSDSHYHRPLATLHLVAISHICRACCFRILAANNIILNDERRFARNERRAGIDIFRY